MNKFIKSTTDLKTKSLEEEIIATKSGPGSALALALILITAIIGYFAYDSASPIALAFWLTAMLITMVHRVWFQPRIEASDYFLTKQKIEVAILFSGLSGLVHASSLFFFPAFTLTERTVQSMILLGLINGSISTNSGYRPLFLAYSLPVIIGLALSWGFSDFSTETEIIAYSVVTLNSLYYAVMCTNAESHFRLFKQSYEIREQHVKLNQILAEKNEALDSALNNAVKASNEADMANKSKTRFLASASHDLRQPTHALSLLAGVLTRQNLDKKSMSIALDIHQASQNLQALMTGLLDISKLDAGLMVPRIETIDLSWLMSRVCNEFETQAYDKGLRLMFVSSYGSATTRSDPQLTERILRNLVSNAVKYTDKGHIEITLNKHNDKWLVTIKDTGHGIDVQEQDRIFEEFYQIANAHRDSANGLGLGLAIVKRLSDTLALDLNLESELNVGSSFSFSLPIINDEHEEAPDKMQNKTLKGVHILCVDDEEDIRRAMSLVFELLKCSFDLVEGIDEAITAAKAKQPDIILADYRLIGERNGVDTIQAIREIYPNIPALLVTGDTSPERLKLANDAGIEMLHKPLAMEVLVQAVGEKLNK